MEQWVPGRRCLMCRLFPGHELRKNRGGRKKTGSEQHCCTRHIKIDYMWFTQVLDGGYIAYGSIKSRSVLLIRSLIEETRSVG